MSHHPPPSPPARRATLLLARSAVAATPREEMSRYATSLAAHPAAGAVAFSFTVQGEPSFFEVFRRLRAERYEEIVILPLLVPLEPSFLAWLSRTLQRWRSEWGEPWPHVRVGQAPVETLAMEKVLADLTALLNASHMFQTCSTRWPASRFIPGHLHRHCCQHMQPPESTRLVPLSRGLGPPVTCGPFTMRPRPLCCLRQRSRHHRQL
jgi:hypothetical protein